MNEAALISLLWPKNQHLLRPYLAQRPRTVYTLAAYANPALQEMVAQSGSRVGILEQLLPEARINALRAEAAEKAQSTARVVEDADWSTFCVAGGCSAKRLRSVLTQDLPARLFESMLLIEALDAARERHAVELLVVNEDLMQAAKTAVLWARNAQIPSLHLSHSAILGQPYTVHHQFNADCMAVFGSRGQAGYLDMGIAPDRMPATGNPAWDAYADLAPRRAEVRHWVFDKYQLQADAPLLVFGTTWAANLTAFADPDIYDRTVRAFLRSCRQLRQSGRRVHCVIKDRASNLGFGRERVGAIARSEGLEPDDYLYTVEDMEALTLAADLLISVDSNLSIEAMLAGTPALNLWDATGWLLGPFFAAEDGVLQVHPDRLADILAQLLDAPALREALLSSLQSRVADFNAGHDGKAAQRVAELMAGLALPLAGTQPMERPGAGYVWEELSSPREADLKGEYHDHPRTELVEMFAHAPRRVLDIGCATGATGQVIKSRWPQAHVTGIELNRAAARIAAQRIDVVLNDKLENLELERYGIARGSIDTVIVADVLEHLYDPWGTLLQLRPYLSDDAQVLASIPNARNLWLINELINGRWSYAQEGLLDVTHLRFFTRQEIEKLFQETGYDIQAVGHTLDGRLAGMSAQGQQRFNLNTDKLTLRNVDEAELQELKTLQFLVLARPRPQRQVAQAAPAVSLPAAPPAPASDPYGRWQAAHAYRERDAQWMAERMASWTQHPRFHLAVIVLPEREEWLARNIDALAAQFYPDWRLTIVAFSPAPEGVQDLAVLNWVQVQDSPLAALNRVLAETEADWVGVFEAGDQIAPHAFFAFADAVNAHPDWQLVYSDEDSLDANGQRSNPHFKPEFNLDLLRSMPYMGGLLLLRRELFAAIGGFDPGMDGAEDYDLVLRAVERLESRHIGHVADVLYHRYSGGGHSQCPVQQVLEQGRQAVAAHLERLAILAQVEHGAFPPSYRVRYAHERQPIVSIIIPTRDQLPYLQRCIESIIEHTRYPHYEILVVDNDSRTPEARAYLEGLRGVDEERLRVLSYPHAFNFSAMNNLAAGVAKGEYLLLLNNDTAVVQADWLDVLMSHAQRPEVGIVGPRLLYPDGKVQHAGVILGLGGSPAEHPFIGYPPDERGYFGRLQLEQNYSAVTGACLLIRKSVYEEVGGLDEARFQVSYNDIDLCLKVRERGYLVTWTPFATLLHEGSVSQKGQVEQAPDAAKQARFAAEQERMYDKWLPQLAFDPAYNRNLNLLSRSFEIEAEAAVTWSPDWRPRPRILVHPADRFGCGEYRIIAPMRALNEAGRVQGWETQRIFTPPEMARMDPDCIVMQRQLEWGQIDAIAQHKRFSRAFRVYEIDDLITNLPVKSVHKAAIYKDIAKRFRKGVGLCDRLVVATEPLAEAFKTFSPDVRVVHNYIERAKWGHLRPQRGQGSKPRVGWAGGSGHTGDLELIADVVRTLSREVDWVFFGLCPEALRPYVREIHEPVPIDDYPAKLASLNLDLALAPLEEIPFNEAKSHLRLLEYGMLGYPVVCTDIFPYRNGFPVTRVRNRYKDWLDAIRDHLNDPEASAVAGSALREHVNRHWVLEDNLDAWLRGWLP